MKLFTKGIDKKLFAQYPKGGSLEGQKVIAKIFNPYGRGRWYIMNSDPDEPDYLWGIVELFQGEPEVGSFSREELENIKVVPIGMQEYARACGNFFDAVQSRTLCHLGDDTMREAIIGSSKRPLGDAWAWNRRSTTNITPLVAATLAHYGITSKAIERELVRSRIF